MTQKIALSRDLKTVLQNIAAHEDKGKHAIAINPTIKTLERRGLIERKLRLVSDPLWLTQPWLGWGLTADGRAALGQTWN